jgi:CheY-like chemotaxis protein
MTFDDKGGGIGTCATPRTVMVVDDHNAMRRMARKLVLESLPHCDVHEARDGRDALVTLVLSRPSLVLMDLHLPDMDGLAATRRILAQAPTTTVIAMSLSDDWRYHRLAAEAGAIAFVPKPDLADRLPILLAGLPGAHV